MSDSMDYSETTTMHQNLIRLHDDSQAVVKLQHALNKALRGVAIPATGVFNQLTERGVTAFQRQAGLAVDGIAGPITIRALQIDMTPSLLTFADFQAAAKTLGVSVAHIQAVAEVETKSAPFWSWANNCTPILFERHQFDRELIKPWKAGQTVASLTQARAAIRISDPDICNPVGGGYGVQSIQYGKLARAAAFGETPALNSASWGSFQIMGYHGIHIGWHSTQAFVRSQQASQQDHLRAFVRFILNDRRLHTALRNSDWATFASIYNGPKHDRYDLKMAAAYNKYAK